MKTQKQLGSAPIILVLLVLLSVLHISSARASHALGGDITYRYIGSGSLQITVNYYRDCDGISFTNNGAVLSSSKGKTTVTLSSSAAVDVTPIATKSCTRCSNPYCSFAFGEQLMSFSGLATGMDTTVCDYTIGFEQTGRPGYITTGASHEDGYLESHVNICAGPHNSPKFVTGPPFVVCKNQCISLYQCALKSTQNDSLVYSLTPPLSAAKTPLYYTSPYNYQEPLKYSGAFGSPNSYGSSGCGGFHYDSISGRLLFDAVKEDVTVMAFKVTQYLKDTSGKWVKCGDVMREATVQVIDCGTNKVPSVGASSNTYYASAGAELKFKIYTGDSPSDTLKFSQYRLEYFGMSFLSDNKQKPTITAAWTPTKYEVRSKPYQFIARVMDNGLPGAYSETLFNIYVTDTFPDYTVTQHDSGCGKVYFEVKVNEQKVKSYQWEVNNTVVSSNKDLIYTMPVNGAYDFKLTVTDKKGYQKETQKTIILNSYPLVNTDRMDTVCLGDSIQLTAHGGKSYIWMTSDSSHVYPVDSPYVKPEKNTKYIVIGTDANGCKDWDTVTVFVKTFDLKASGSTTVCPGQLAVLEGTYYPNYTYHWEPATYLNSTTFYKVNCRPLKTTTYKVTATSPLGCRKTDSVTVYVYKPKGTAGPDLSVCLGDSVQLQAAGGNSYTWTTAPGLSDTKSPNPYVKPLSDQKYVVRITDSMNCFPITDTVLVKVTSLNATALAKTSMCAGDTASLWVQGGQRHHWLPAQYISNDTSAQPQAFPPQSQWFYVLSQDTVTGCSDYDSVYVEVRTDCVWPGDANHDGLVNYLDLLNMGIAYQDSGYARTNASEAWHAQMAADWGRSFANNVNYKHADATGDGKVNDKDVATLKNNYGLKHKYGEAFHDTTGNIPLYFKFTRDTFYAGDTVTAALNIGSSANPLLDLYGLGITYQYSDTWVVPSTEQFAFNCDFLCYDDTGALRMHVPYLNTAEASFVRTDHYTRSGYGNLAGIAYILKDSTHNYDSLGNRIYLRLTSARVVDNKGKAIGVTLVDDSAVVMRVRPHKEQDTTSGISAANASTCKVYPNPASQQLIVETGKTSARMVRLTDLLGHTLLVQDARPQEKLSLDVSSFRPGLYILIIETAQGRQAFNIAIQH